MAIVRNCRHCGNKFANKPSKPRYCSDGCRFDAKTAPSPDGCVLWIASTRRHGYGQFGYTTEDGRHVNAAAHRYAWERHIGEIPDGMLVCHRCDTPGCVLVAHLFLGTTQDNADDMVSKGRQATGSSHGSALHPERVACGDRNGSRRHPEKRLWSDSHALRLRPELVPRGETHGSSKLTEASVRAIRSTYVAGGTIYSDLATLYSVSKSTIACVIQRKTWAHVKDPS